MTATYASADAGAIIGAPRLQVARNATQCGRLPEAKAGTMRGMALRARQRALPAVAPFSHWPAERTSDRLRPIARPLNNNAGRRGVPLRVRAALGARGLAWVTMTYGLGAVVAGERPSRCPMTFAAAR
jgi:hypothetical protein